MVRKNLIWAAVNGFVVVLIGAFGAHGLEDIISSEMLEVYNTGVQYHMFHALALVAVACAARESVEKEKLLRWSSRLFLLGIILFSGSLYALSISGIRILGIITPVGGVALLAAWALLAYAVYTSNSSQGDKIND